ncbi:MAG: hypothetical protein M5U26_05750 [Planctomycetota bacterium]|nr:hypothetical protein [Planctomycetota bacterium]
MKRLIGAGTLALAGLLFAGSAALAGDGEAPDEKKAERCEQRWQKVLERFDKDGDGKLGKEEFMAMAEARHAQHGQRGKHRKPKAEEQAAE